MSAMERLREMLARGETLTMQCMGDTTRTLGGTCRGHVVSYDGGQSWEHDEGNPCTAWPTTIVLPPFTPPT